MTYLRIGRGEESGVAAVPRFERVMMARAHWSSGARARTLACARRWLSIWRSCTSRLGEGYAARLCRVIFIIIGNPSLDPSNDKRIAGIQMYQRVSFGLGREYIQVIYELRQ
jgi:hypothetical protein